MSLITNIVTLLTTNIWATLFTILLIFILYKLTKFYVKVYNLPPGPIPLPFLGNLTYFRGTKELWSLELEKVADKYGPICTFWTGSFPLVLISDINIARDEFSKNNFSGRPQSILNELFSYGNNVGIGTSDYGPHWEALRKVTHLAVQKYSTTDKLVYLVSDCVDYTIKTIIEKEGLNKPFRLQQTNKQSIADDYIYNTFLNILATSAFGQRYEFDDPEYKSIKYVQRDLLIELNSKLMFWEMIPILRIIQRKEYNKLKSAFDENYKLLRNKFKSHYKDYNQSIVRDFCDALISAKNDALREGKESTPHLTDENLTLAIFDMFIAGTVTSQLAFIWIVFFMTYYPQVLSKMSEEINTQIGDRIPTHEDRERCHYVMAVISETMRLRNVSPIGVIHKTIVDTNIGDYKITKGTQISVFQGHIMHNEKYWMNAHEFSPERFLNNGKYVTTRPKAYIPFGIGRRKCLGEKMAIADLFLVLVRFIQKTSEYELVLHYSGDTKPNPNNAFNFLPKDFQISFNSKQKD